MAFGFRRRGHRNSRAVTGLLILVSAAALLGGGCTQVPEAAPRVRLSFAEPGPECATGSCGLQAAEFAAIEVPADIALDPRRVGTARISGDVQTVGLRLRDGGFSPGVVLVRRGVPAALVIRRDAALQGVSITVPVYGVSAPLAAGETVLEVLPEFDFTAALEGRPERLYVRVLDSVGPGAAREAAAVVERYLELARPAR